ncbi:MAG: carotenoid 1,2-hydratase [Gammaproteobacteria bacterium]|jgi:predicted secreted hydrolase|nr:carotenoid 1,2-hydratase [Gammaproteobacteria bacterium]
MPRLLLLLLPFGVLLAWLAFDGPEPVALPATGWQVTEVLGGDDAGFARVTASAPFEFPRDHGPHPDYRHEWWYLTGHLEDGVGRGYGFQLTLFRFGLSARPTAVDTPSAWRTDSLYMAHFTVTDVEGGRFHAFERFARPALDLAGARATPFAAWVGPWRLESAGDGLFPMRLSAGDDGVALDLTLVAEKPVVAQGDGGTSRKGPEPGNATRYYSLPRLAARGRLQLDGAAREVHGSAWLDREWGSSALGDGVRGWDWFGLQLDDGRDLMLYRLRRDDGGTDPFSAGSVVAVDGTVTPLTATDFVIEPRGEWRTADGVAYPAQWRLTLPEHDLDLEVRPLLADQELRLAVRYWEGAVAVSGSVAGRGYAELTGYAGASLTAPR